MHLWLNFFSVAFNVRSQLDRVQRVKDEEDVEEPELDEDDGEDWEEGRTLVDNLKAFEME